MVMLNFTTMIKLIHGDCLEKMAKIADGSVDMVLTDPPYGTTACKWDSIIPLEPMWKHLKRVIKPNGAIVMTGQEPYSSALRMSNASMWRYDWVWIKSRPSGFMEAKNKPMKKHEIVSVFSKAKCSNGCILRMEYNPQGLTASGKKISRSKRGDVLGERPNQNNEYVQKFTGYPNTLIDVADGQKGKVHPTQKPVALMEYLIKTYTNEGETVLDFTMGSGTTGVACKNLNRSFIGIEKDEKYFQLASDRIDSHNDKDSHAK